MSGKRKRSMTLSEPRSIDASKKTTNRKRESDQPLSQSQATVHRLTQAVLNLSSRDEDDIAAMMTSSVTLLTHVVDVPSFISFCQSYQN